jgi:hypothetical protein
MAKDCDNLSPSPDLQAIAITPGALLSPSLSKTKTPRPPLGLPPLNHFNLQHSIFFSRKY